VHCLLIIKLMGGHTDAEREGSPKKHSAGKGEGQVGETGSNCASNIGKTLRTWYLFPMNMSRCSPDREMAHIEEGRGGGNALTEFVRNHIGRNRRECSNEKISVREASEVQGRKKNPIGTARTLSTGTVVKRRGTPCPAKIINQPEGGSIQFRYAKNIENRKVP